MKEVVEISKDNPSILIDFKIKKSGTQVEYKYQIKDSFANVNKQINDLTFSKYLDNLNSIVNEHHNKKIKSK